MAKPLYKGRRRTIESWFKTKLRFGLYFSNFSGFMYLKKSVFITENSNIAEITAATSLSLCQLHANILDSFSDEIKKNYILYYSYFW